MNHAREKINSKIVTLPEFLKLKKENKIIGKTVYTNGCFDIIHKGHIETLSRASEFGDCLILGLNGDDSVTRLKGEGRPVQDEVSRALILAAMEFISFVIIFEEDTPLEMIKAIQPDVLIKGGDYKPDEIVGYEVMNQNGGEVYCLNFIEGYSSTRIITKIKT